MYQVRLYICCLILALGMDVPLAAQDVDCLHRTLPLNIIDSRRRLVRLSDPSELEGKLGGQPVKILAVKPDERPHRMVILLDTSGSMLGQSEGSKWRMARFVAMQIAHANWQDTSLALLVFSDRVTEQIDFSQGSSAVARRLSEIATDNSFTKTNVQGTTAMRDAILSALRLMDDPNFVNSIYLITDGGDNKSKNGFRSVRDALDTAGVRLFVTLLSPDDPGHSAPEEQAGPIEAADLAAATGGFVLGPLGAGAFGRVSYNLSKDQWRGVAIGLDGLYMAMTRNDLIEIELPQTLNKWSRWSLQFTHDLRKTHKDWLVVYPSELTPCSAPDRPH
jgi:hypothetical protein